MCKTYVTKWLNNNKIFKNRIHQSNNALTILTITHSSILLTIMPVYV